MPVAPEALCRLASIVCVLNEAADNAAMKLNLHGDARLHLVDVEGNAIDMWTEDGKLVIASIA